MPVCFFLLLVLASEDSPLAPSFADYPVTDIFQGEPAAVDFSSDPDARRFKTRLQHGIKAGANFAGSYTLVLWGCGSSCQSFSILHTATGRIVFSETACTGVEFKLESGLLIVNPPDEDIYPICPVKYFVMKNGVMTALTPGAN